MSHDTYLHVLHVTRPACHMSYKPHVLHTSSIDIFLAIAYDYFITELRKINKIHPDFTSDIVQRYSNAFVDLFSTGKTQVIKNMLSMVNQMSKHLFE